MSSFLHFKHLLLLLIISLVCCVPMYQYRNVGAPDHINHVDHIPIRVSSAFTDAQVESISEAAAEWNYVLNGQIVLEIDKDKFVDLDQAKGILHKDLLAGEGWIIFSLESDDPLLDGEVDPGDGTLAFVTRAGGHVMVVVNDQVGKRDIKTIVMHEMGHLLGAGHVNMPSLMTPYYGGDMGVQYNCIDKTTAAQVATWNHLDFSTLNYCLTPNFE